MFLILMKKNYIYKFCCMYISRSMEVSGPQERKKERAYTLIANYKN